MVYIVGTSYLRWQRHLVQIERGDTGLYKKSQEVGQEQRLGNLTGALKKAWPKQGEDAS